MLDPARKYQLTLRLSDIRLEKNAAIGTLGMIGLGLGGALGAGATGYGLYHGIPALARGGGRLAASGMSGLGQLLQGSGARAFRKFKERFSPMTDRRITTGRRGGKRPFDDPTMANQLGIDIGDAFRPTFGSYPGARSAQAKLQFGGAGLARRDASALRRQAGDRSWPRSFDPVGHRLDRIDDVMPTTPERFTLPGLADTPRLPKDVPGLWRMREGKRMRRWSERLKRFSRTGRTRQLERMRAAQGMPMEEWARLESRRRALASARDARRGVQGGAAPKRRSLFGGGRQRAATDPTLYNPISDPMPARTPPRSRTGNRLTGDRTGPGGSDDFGFAGITSPVAGMERAHNAFRSLDPAAQSAAMSQHGSVANWFRQMQRLSNPT